MNILVYQLMFGDECTLPMDVGLLGQDPDRPDPITSPYAVWVRDALEMAYDQVRRHSGQVVRRQKRLYDRRAVRRLFAVGDWVLRYYSPAKKCKLDSDWVGPYLVVSLAGRAVGIQLHRDSAIILVHCQDSKKIPCHSGLVSWIDAARRLAALRKVHFPSIVVLPPNKGAILSEIASVKSAQFFSESRSCRLEGSGMDVSSAALSSAVVSFPHKIILVDAIVTYIHSLHTGWMLGLSVLRQLLMHSIIGSLC